MALSSKALLVAAGVLATVGIGLLLIPDGPHEPGQAAPAATEAPPAPETTPVTDSESEPAPDPSRQGDEGATDESVPIEDAPAMESNQPQQAAPPTRDAQSRAAAAELGIAVVTAYASGETDQESWWASLAPLLTDAGQDIYDGVNASLVPPVIVTGDAEVDTEASAYLALVEVPTDRGDYRVVLTRGAENEPWLAERIDVP